jgi:hypothetical protein
LLQDQQLLSTLTGSGTGPAVDESSRENAAASGSSAAEGTAALGSTDGRLEAVVQYRLQRKLLVDAGRLLLRRFLDSA